MSCRGKLLPFYITMTTIDKPVQELWDWYIDRQVGNDHPTIKMKLSRFNGRICLFDFRKKVVFSWKYSLIGNFLKLRSKNYFRIFCEIEDNQVERYMKPNRSEWVSQVRVCTLRKICLNFEKKQSILECIFSLLLRPFLLLPELYRLYWWNGHFQNPACTDVHTRFYLWQKNEDKLKYCTENNKSMNRGEIIKVMKDQENCHDIHVLQFSYAKYIFSKPVPQYH